MSNRFEPLNLISVSSSQKKKRASLSRTPPQHAPKPKTNTRLMNRSPSDSDDEENIPKVSNPFHTLRLNRASSSNLSQNSGSKSDEFACPAPKRNGNPKVPRTNSSTQDSQRTSGIPPVRILKQQTLLFSKPAIPEKLNQTEFQEFRSIPFRFSQDSEADLTEFSLSQLGAAEELSQSQSVATQILTPENEAFRLADLDLASQSASQYCTPSDQPIAAKSTVELGDELAAAKGERRAPLQRELSATELASTPGSTPGTGTGTGAGTEAGRSSHSGGSGSACSAGSARVAGLASALLSRTGSGAFLKTAPRGGGGGGGGSTRNAVDVENLATTLTNCSYAHMLFGFVASKMDFWWPDISPEVSGTTQHNIFATDLVETKEPKKKSATFTANLRLYREFDVMAELGQGSFGKVFKCQNRLDGCFYAVKRLIRKMTGDGRRKDQLREVFALALLHSSGNAPTSIIRYFNSWVEEGFLHIQTELCGRGNLHTQRVEGRVFDADLLVQVCLQMAQALAFIHQKRMIHLDVKPENMFESVPGCFKLGDFGLALPLDGPHSPAARGELSFEGDRRYLSREVLQGTHLDHLDKGDIFSLGMSLYELIRGDALPTNGPLWDQLRYGIVRPSEQLPENSLLLTLIRSMISANPADRPSAAELVDFILAQSSPLSSIPFTKAPATTFQSPGAYQAPPSSSSFASSSSSACASPLFPSASPSPCSPAAAVPGWPGPLTLTTPGRVSMSDAVHPLHHDADVEAMRLELVQLRAENEALRRRQR